MGNRLNLLDLVLGAVLLKVALYLGEMFGQQVQQKRVDGLLEFYRGLQIQQGF